MKYKQLLPCLLTFTFSLCLVTDVPAQSNDEAELNTPGENVIFQWNRVLQETVRTPGQQPPTIFPVRSFAMMHAAMFDAVNSIEGSHAPYLIEVHAGRRASQEAATAKAAHDVLVALYPARQDIFAVELMNSLKGISLNRARQGIAVGEKVAEEMLALRANDGWNVTPPPYSLPLFLNYRSSSLKPCITRPARLRAWL